MFVTPFVTRQSLLYMWSSGNVYANITVDKYSAHMDQLETNVTALMSKNIVLTQTPVKQIMFVLKQKRPSSLL